MNGTLYIVATPIGNTGDITKRAREILGAVHAIYAEDTRVTRKLLTLLDIPYKDIMTLHQHSPERVYVDVEARLQRGESVAYVSDAGTPGISDPGGLLVAHLYAAGQQRIVAVPGPSAVTAALSIAGVRADKYLFLGFPPHKHKREKFFEEVIGSTHTVVFYESSHRIGKALQSIKELLSDEERTICVCRELTKKFESVYRGSIQELISMSIPAKGEFVVVVEGRR